MKIEKIEGVVDDNGVLWVLWKDSFISIAPKPWNSCQTIEEGIAWLKVVGCIKPGPLEMALEHLEKYEEPFPGLIEKVWVGEMLRELHEAMNE